MGERTAAAEKHGELEQRAESLRQQDAQQRADHDRDLEMIQSDKATMEADKQQFRSREQQFQEERAQQQGKWRLIEEQKQKSAQEIRELQENLKVAEGQKSSLQVKREQLFVTI